MCDGGGGYGGDSDGGYGGDVMVMMVVMVVIVGIVVMVVMVMGYYKVLADCANGTFFQTVPLFFSDRPTGRV